MTNWLDDPDALSEQYADASNLNARIALHATYSTAERDLHRWIFDQFDLPEHARVLGLGCGPANLWVKNDERIPDDWDVTVTDASSGMVEEARENLVDSSHEFAFEVVDAQDIPFDAETFDAVTANHMLYHVPDREAAFREIHRVLAPGGALYASTNGKSNMRVIKDVQDAVHNETLPRTTGFELETGGDQLRNVFADVEIKQYDTALEVTDVEPLVEYSLSRNEFEESDAPALREAFVSEFEDGVLCVEKDVGLFVARKPS